MVTADKYAKAISDYSKSITSKSNSAQQVRAAKESLRQSGLLEKNGSLKKEIVSR